MPDIGFFMLSENFATRQIQGYFKYDNSSLTNSTQKLPK